MSLSLLNIVCPCAGFGGRINAQADNLAPALGELGLKPGMTPSSVVHTGVKSFGCEKRIAQPSPIHSRK